MSRWHNTRVNQTLLRAVILPMIVLAAACNGTDAAAPEVPTDPGDVEPPTLPLNEIRVLSLDTYDGSGQTVHPDVVSMPTEWSTNRRYLAVTPYPNGQASEENPSIFGSDNGIAWKEPTEKMNPIVKPRSYGHLSDPDILYNRTTEELWMYYREVVSDNSIYLMRSKDGTIWTEPKLVVRAPSHQVLSPSVVRKANGDWLMWSVNAGGAGCGGSSTQVELRRSRDGIEWDEPEDASLEIRSMYAWHIDVIWVAKYKQYWAVYNAKTSGSCTTGLLYFATSTDGIYWTTFPQPLLERGVIPEFQDVVYRAAMEYDETNDEITFWYSGARYSGGKYNWQSAVQRRTRDDVFALANTAPVLSKQRISARKSLKVPSALRTPGLSNETAP